MQRVTTDGENAIAPAVPELIKKQDHTPVQRKGGKDAEPGLRFPPQVSLRSDNSLPLDNSQCFLCVSG